MSTEKEVPYYMDPSFLRGLTQSRITRRSALQGAGAVSLAAFLAACGIGSKPTVAAHTNWVWDKATKAGVLDFANWPLYIDVVEAKGKTTYPTLEQFTKETGIKVNYSEPIQDNNSFFAKEAPILQQGQSIGYDIIVVTNGIFLTDYLAKGWLTELDPTKLPNFTQYAAPRVQARDFDPGNKFTIPWQSGFTGIGYNPALTKREITSFNDLFDPAFKGKVGMFSENQDTGNMALLGIGVKPEKSTPADWQKAADKLKTQRDQGIVRKYYDQSYIDALSKGETAISMAWSGDIFQANLSAGNNNLKFVIPNEGGVIWTDNMCIPLGASHPLDAITYMNWVYQPRIAATMAEYIEYITPVPSAQDFIKQDAAAAKAAADKASLLELSTDPAIFPTQDLLAKTSYYRVLNAAETTQWNDIFNAVIIA
ncbi:MAG TPA: spermidine/putrescine ABC transporter substrate-binding protein [Candidatus Dormibacteraeota bacterium]|nr:spermidine/putrescine ABC transporter substrate-binding protein [Candidatus Dormibacteraeota bacterium]